MSGFGVNGKVRFASRKNKHVETKAVYEPGGDNRTWPKAFEQMRCKCKRVDNFMVRAVSTSENNPNRPYWKCEIGFRKEGSCGAFNWEDDLVQRYESNEEMWRKQFGLDDDPSKKRSRDDDGDGNDNNSSENGRPAKRQRTTDNDTWKPPERRPTGNAFYGDGGYAEQSVPARKNPNLQVYCNCGPAQATYSRKRGEYFFTCMHGKDNEGACKFWLFESKLDDGRVDPKRDMIVDNLTLYTSPHTNNARENADDGAAAEAAFARLCADRGLSYTSATHFEHVIHYMSGTVGTGPDAPVRDRFGVQDYTVDVYYNRLPEGTAGAGAAAAAATSLPNEVLEAGPIWVQVYGIRLDARGSLQDSKADRLVFFVRRGPGHDMECVHLDRRALHAYVCDQVVDTDLVNSVAAYKNANMSNVEDVGNITDADQDVQATSARMVFDPAAAYGGLYSRFGSYDIQTLVTLDDLVAWDANVRPGLPLLADRPLVLDRWEVTGDDNQLV